MGFKCSDENCNSFQQNLIKINMKDVKDMHRGMIKKLLQYHMTLLEKNINAQHLTYCATISNKVML